MRIHNIQSQKTSFTSDLNWEDKQLSGADRYKPIEPRGALDAFKGAAYKMAWMGNGRTEFCLIREIGTNGLDSIRVQVAQKPRWRDEFVSFALGQRAPEIQRRVFSVAAIVPNGQLLPPSTIRTFTEGHYLRLDIYKAAQKALEGIKLKGCV